MEKRQLISTVAAAQSGDNDALNTLFNEYYNDLYYFALKTVKDEETALDVTQEAFVEIINTFSNLKEPAAFVTWAKQITYHQCTRYFKKKKDVLVSEDEDGNTVFDTLQEDNAEFIPDEALDKSDFKKTIMAILDELSEEQRSATMMYYFDEMSIKQIAEIQGVSEGTVKSRLNYARKAIKNSVEEYEKKNGIKLHAIPFFPFFKWLFEGSFEGGMPLASAELVAEGIATATGTTVTVATATTTATTVATTTATAVGIGAKIAAMPLVTKIFACVVAGIIVVGAGATAVILSQKGNSEPTNNQSVVSSENDSSNVDTNSSSEGNNTVSTTDNSSTDTTTNDGSSSNSNSSNDTSSSGNSANSGNSSNTSSGNNTSNSSDTETAGIIYYDINRKTQSNLTKETVKRNLENLKSTLQPAKTKVVNGNTVDYYRIDDLVAAFSQFDILGYNFTKEDILQGGGLYNRNGFFDDRIDENNETYVSFPTEYSHTVHLKTKEDAFNLLKSDITTFFKYMGNSHRIKLMHFGYPYDGIPTVVLENATVEDYTDEMIRELAFDSKVVFNLCSLSDNCSNKNDSCGSFNFNCTVCADGTVEYIFSISF